MNQSISACITQFFSLLHLQSPFLQNGQSDVKNYLSLHESNPEADVKRKEDYATMVNYYYDLVTEFYEWGWCQSFHFAIRHHWESFHGAIARHEFYLAHRLNIQPGQKVIDIGCGVGGPARNIARLTGANIVGLNNNENQVQRAIQHTLKQGLSKNLRFVKGDFMNLPFENDTFDSVYQIEATAHAPDKVACYREIFRVLKPGQMFGGYEWCLTDKYDASNPEHVNVKKGIEIGDGLPDIASTHQVLDALREAGFEIVESRDIAEEYDPKFNKPWYEDLQPSYFWPSRIQFTPVGSIGRVAVLTFLEKIKLAPQGTTAVSDFLATAARSLVRGGELEIFTPMFFYMVRKPLTN